MEDDDAVLVAAWRDHITWAPGGKLSCTRRSLSPSAVVGYSQALDPDWQFALYQYRHYWYEFQKKKKKFPRMTGDGWCGGHGGVSNGWGGWGSVAASARPHVLHAHCCIKGEHKLATYQIGRASSHLTWRLRHVMHPARLRVCCRLVRSFAGLDAASSPVGLAAAGKKTGIVLPPCFPIVSVIFMLPTRSVFSVPWAIIWEGFRNDKHDSRDGTTGGKGVTWKNSNRTALRPADSDGEERKT